MAPTKKASTPPKVSINQQLLNINSPEAAVAKLLDVGVAIPGSGLASGKGTNLQRRFIKALRGLGTDPVVRDELSAFVLWCVGGPNGIVVDPYSIPAGADARDPVKVAARVRTIIQSLDDYHAEQAGLAVVDKRRQDALRYLETAYERLSKLPNKTPINDPGTMNFGKRGLLQWAGLFLFGADEFAELIERQHAVEELDLPAATARLERVTRKAVRRGSKAVAWATVIGGVLGFAASGTLSGFISGAILTAILLSVIVYLLFRFAIGEARSIFFRAIPQMDQDAFDQRVRNECLTIFNNTGLNSPDEIKKFKLVDQFEAVVELQMSKEGLSFKRYDDRINNLVEQFIDNPIPVTTPTAPPNIIGFLVRAFNWLKDL